MNKILIILSFVLLASCGPSQEDKTNIAPPRPVLAVKEWSRPVLAVKEWVYAVPLEDISTVNVWGKAGAKNTPDNQVVKSFDVSTKIGILERTELPSGSVYFHVELEDGARGYVGRPFVTKDMYGHAFYEENSSTGEKLRDGKGYSFSSGNNCILHVAALMTRDVTKGEFETTKEFEQRKASELSSNPWFSNDITYAYTYSLSGDYDADNQEFTYLYANYIVGFDVDVFNGNLGFDHDCADEFGYRTVYYEGSYGPTSGKAKTLVTLVGAKLPKEFVERPDSSFKRVVKRIERAKARAFKEVILVLGVKPTGIESVSRGDNNAYYGGPSDHHTKLKGGVSYLFLLTRDGKNVIESYVSNKYKRTWQRDLQSQLAIAGYDVGAIDGFAGGATERALESAAADGVLPNAEMSMRSTMVLINHNRSK